MQPNRCLQNKMSHFVSLFGEEAAVKAIDLLTSFVNSFDLQMVISAAKESTEEFGRTEVLEPRSIVLCGARAP